ncbi:MAG: adenine methyltransferase [Candidatus Sericytochromatia bacterium]|nr:MAG: adenine methyltransferase [Candidatus Sericytochromatia bacterium]
MEGTSLDIIKQKLEELKKIIPECFTENKIDWEKLKVFFDQNIEFKNERYHLSWAGKTDAYRILQIPTYKTLKPCKEESENFDNTENVFIEGDNLEVLKVLQKAYFGKIKMIYIDPPYNTGNDFIYKDDFSQTLAEYKKQVGDIDDNGNATKVGLFKNTKENGQYHSNWLNMMLPRLFLARSLLRDDGVIFVSIDDNEVHNLRLLMDEIFGEENFIIKICVKKSSEIASNFTIQKHEYLVCYAKNIFLFNIQFNKKYTISRGTVGNKEQTMPVLEFPAGIKCINLNDGIYKETRKIQNSYENVENLDPIIIENGILKNSVRLKARWRSSNDLRNFFNNQCKPTKAKIAGEIIDVYFDNDRFIPQIKKLTYEKISSLILNNPRGSNDLDLLNINFFEFPKSVTFIKELAKFSPKDSLILDFFAGSGTTAHAVMELNKEDGGNRKWILVQLPEPTDPESEAYKAGYKTIADIAKERIRRAAKKIKEEIEEQKEIKLDLGFKVFKLDESNFKQWRPFVPENAEQIKQMTLEFVDNVKPESTEENMLYELMLKNGKKLTDKVEKKNNYFVINGNELVIMLEKVDKDIINDIIKFKPKKVIALDKIFNGNDSLKTNTFLQFKDELIEFRSV